MEMVKAENRRWGFGVGVGGGDFGERRARTVEDVVSALHSEMGLRRVVGKMG